jgi:CubicO group peptidase (beta-lactamase class C family)
MQLATSGVASKILQALPLAVLALAGSATHVRAQTEPAAPSPARLQRLSEFFENEVAAGKLAGAIVMIRQHGRPVYFRCFGVRDVATKQPMTPDTIFALHSMTKPITSLAAMMLIDDGRLALADPVSKFIPAFSDVRVGVETGTKDGNLDLERVPPDRPVTIEDLLRHTSGISYDYIGGPWVMKVYSEARIFDGHFDNKEFAQRIARLPLARQPGTLWRYGHSTDVLGRVIEVVSGKTLHEFMQERILLPLGMTSTKFVLHGAAEWARMAEPLPDDAILRLAEHERRAHTEWESGGGGLVSTITDYARFAQMLLNGGNLDGRQYLSRAAYELMTTDHIGPDSGVARDYFYFPGDGFGFGYGLGVRTDPGNAKPPPPGSIGELKWDSGSGTYFGVDPKLDMVYLLMEQTQTERGRIVPAFKTLVYDAFEDR